MKLDVIQKRQVIKSVCRTVNDNKFMWVMLMKVLLTTHLLPKLRRKETDDQLMS